MPTQALITDFTYTPSDGGAAATEPRFTDGSLTGGGSFYPSTLTSDLTQNNWHISGTIDNYAGFNLYFDNCDVLDVSTYKGISFTLSGTVAKGSQITMGVGTAADKTSAAWLIKNGSTTAKSTDSGTCTPTADTNNIYYTPGCSDPTTTITVPSTPTTVTVLWSDLTGGSPLASPDPSAITSIYWSFPTPTGVGTAAVTSYAVDIVIDDLSFVQ